MESISVGNVSERNERINQKFFSFFKSHLKVIIYQMAFGKSSQTISCTEIAENTIREDVKPSLSFLQSNISNPFLCNLCGRSFSGIQYLRKHEKIHTKSTIFTCSVCSYAFSNLYLLSAHEREMHGIYHAPKRRGCPPGPRKRILEGQMEEQVGLSSLVEASQSRIRVSSFAKPPFEPPMPSFDKPFKCLLCVRSFRNEQALALHEGVHNDGRLFPCSICDRQFTYLHALKNHERIHMNVKPVPCSFCGKLFTMESRRKLQCGISVVDGRIVPHRGDLDVTKMKQC